LRTPENLMANQNAKAENWNKKFLRQGISEWVRDVGSTLHSAKVQKRKPSLERSKQNSNKRNGSQTKTDLDWVLLSCVSYRYWGSSDGSGEIVNEKVNQDSDLEQHMKKLSNRPHSNIKMEPGQRATRIDWRNRWNLSFHETIEMISKKNKNDASRKNGVAREVGLKAWGSAKKSV
jgi:hypothetical protein